MSTLTKREIKALKRCIKENGVINIGYWYELEKIIIFNDVQIALENCDYLLEVYNNEKSEVYKRNIILTEIINWMNYQEFKKCLPYIFGGY